MDNASAPLAQTNAPKTRTASRSDYLHFVEIPTRWMDNDVYGHVNNVVYYSYFDTAVNTHLVQEAGLEIRTSPIIGVVVETLCRYHRELTFPNIVDAGLRVERLGRTSVTYSIGLFCQGLEEPSATGHFVHVYIDRVSRVPVAVPAPIREALELLCVKPPEPEAEPEPTVEIAPGSTVEVNLDF